MLRSVAGSSLLLLPLRFGGAVVGIAQIAYDGGATALAPIHDDLTRLADSVAAALAAHGRAVPEGAAEASHGAAENGGRRARPRMVMADGGRLEGIVAQGSGSAMLAAVAAELRTVFGCQVTFGYYNILVLTRFT